MVKYKINFDSNGRNYIYRGDLIEETKDHVIIKDFKIGKVTLNKKNIISMIPIQQKGDWFE